ncbi:hypothetical protein FM106_21695 [Brachybacterium faecium]|nr:hypothetical protein FM106_21695 [Brachybacterium faecium]
MVKWYGSGQERASEALVIISKIINALTVENHRPLVSIFEEAYRELEKPTQSPTLILSRLQLSLSGCLTKNEIVLPRETQELLSQLSSLSYIRYGS